jgi:hypothetical protein
VLGGGIVEENVSASGRLWLVWGLVSVWMLCMRDIRDGIWEFRLEEMGIGKLRIALRSAMGSEGCCCYGLLHSVRDA